MKRFLFAAAMIATAPVFAADIGVSVTVGQPGFYGTIDINNYPRPRLIYPEPIIIQRDVVYRQPAYLHVPPGHAKDWGKHCHKYDACFRPIYFVQENWYNGVYVPQYQREHRGGGKSHGKGHGHGNKGKGKKN